MSDDPKTLREFAKENGIELWRPSANGLTERVSDLNLQKMLVSLGFDVPASNATTEPRCFTSDALCTSPGWGISLQLYELRSKRNWGIGDFADLWSFCDLAAALGADFVGLNPLHAGFLYDPDRCSPYEPSNRTLLNPLYIAVDEVGGYASSPETAQTITHLRDGHLVDYKQVAEVKLGALRKIWEAQRDSENIAFAAFVLDGGEALHLHALFEAISKVMAGKGQGAGWTSWPDEFRSRASPDVSAFEKTHADDILFHKWLQWCAHVQLAEAKERARSAGMRVGLYLDLAVGEALDGSATWSNPDVYVSGAAIGNPPEPLAADGQDWRLAALLPAKIADGENSPLRGMLSAAMKYSGAVRIDHAAAFARLFLVPIDGVPADGAYVAYPTRSMLTVLAELSKAYQCLVIGEDLGNVADGLRDDLADADVLSYRILSFEQTEQAFNLPESYPQKALACVSTHDHQTFNGWWKGKDIDLRLKHGLVSSAATVEHRTNRARERLNLLAALRKAELISPDDDTTLKDDDCLVVAAYRYIARTPCLLVSVRLADMTDERVATNIPGTNSSHPNWRPKLTVSLEALPSVPLVRRISEAVLSERPTATPRCSR